jgi:alginate O-acetyltransferase complex protein AlgI
LWHGANWNFVAWGGYHGALLSLERMFRRPKPALAPANSKSRAMLYPLRVIVTFGLAMAGWVFFRAATFHDSMYVLGQMLRGPLFAATAGVVLIPQWMIYLALITLALAIVEEKKAWFERVAVGPAWAYGAVCAVLLLSVELIGFSGPAVPFVYFQF